MAGDTSRAKVVLFGGNDFVDGAPQVLGDTWEWDGTAWTQIEETGPSARAGHCMAFDSVRGRTVLFGGIDALRVHIPCDTWEWSGTAWVQATEFGPAARLETAMSFDGTQSLIFGEPQRRTGVQTGMGDTWSWNGKFWTQRQDIGPAAQA